MITFRPLNLTNIETDNSKPAERRGRKAMDLKLRALRNKTARLPKSIAHYVCILCLVEPSARHFCL